MHQDIGFDRFHHDPVFATGHRLFAVRAAGSQRNMNTEGCADAGSGRPEFKRFVESSENRCELRHVYQCQQILTVGAGGLICHIEHVKIHSQREALREYFKRCGFFGRDNGANVLRQHRVPSN